MENTQQSHRNISAPNLLNICVDGNFDGEVSGRLYHCYSVEPILFSNIIELIRETEKLFDTIAFPQASTKTRSLVEKNDKTIMQVCRPDRVADPKEVIQKQGGLGTFITNVRFRQNSTWQGELFWMEGAQSILFSSTLDIIKEIDMALRGVNKSEC